MATGNPLLDAALHYAGIGWHVFPCRPGTKAPLTTHGCKDATTDPELIKAWWTRWPNSNVAVACGTASGIHVVDVDLDEDKSGWESLKEFEALPVTVTQDTPRGGAHFIFATDTPPKNKNNLRPGIDIRSDGYYIMVPPSLHPNGKRYAWRDNHAPGQVELAEFPEDLRPPERTLLPWESATPAPAPKSEPVATVSTPRNVYDRARSYLMECDPAVQGSNGHDKLLWAARAMVVGFELDRGTAISLLWSDYNPRCVPPWDYGKPSERKDFERKVEEAIKTPGQKPRGWLLDEYGLRFTNDDALLVQGRTMVANLLAGNGTHSEAENAAPQVTPLRRENDLPDEMFLPPGFIADFVKYATEQAPYPNRPVAFAAALATMSLLSGRKYKTAQGVRPNLFIAVLADSGTGKEYPRSVIDRLAVAAGFSHMVGNRFASGEGIEDVLRETPSFMFKVDEVDSLLRPLGRPGDNLIENMMSTLLSFYGESGSVHVCRAKAGQAVADRTAIEAPNLVILGTAIPRNFYGALEERVITSGLLSRFLVVDVKRPRIGQDAVEIDLPLALIEKAAKLANFWPTGDGTKGNIATTLNPVPVIVPATSEAEKLQREFRKKCDDQAERAIEEGDTVSNAVVVRSWERAWKLALLYAISENHEQPLIGVDAFQWGIRLETFCSNSLLAMYGRYGASSEFEKSCRKVEEAIAVAKNRAASRSDLLRITRFPAKQFDEIIRTLTERGTVQQGTESTKGRMATVYSLAGR